jgi:hypothetical protein
VYSGESTRQGAGSKARATVAVNGFLAAVGWSTRGRCTGTLCRFRTLAHRTAGKLLTHGAAAGGALTRALSPWGAETGSGCDLVLVDEAAE